MTRKICMTDFAGNKALRQHAQRSREVARALDAKAYALPHSRMFTSVEFE